MKVYSVSESLSIVSYFFYLKVKDKNVPLVAEYSCVSELLLHLIAI